MTGCPLTDDAGMVGQYEGSLRRAAMILLQSALQGVGRCVWMRSASSRRSVIGRAGVIGVFPIHAIARSGTTRTPGGRVPG